MHTTMLSNELFQQEEASETTQPSVQDTPFSSKASSPIGEEADVRDNIPTSPIITITTFSDDGKPNTTSILSTMDESAYPPTQYSENSTAAEALVSKSTHILTDESSAQNLVYPQEDSSSLATQEYSIAAPEGSNKPLQVSGMSPIPIEELATTEAIDAKVGAPPTEVSAEPSTPGSSAETVPEKSSSAPERSRCDSPTVPLSIQGASAGPEPISPSAEASSTATPVSQLPERSFKFSSTQRSPMVGLPRMQTFKRQLSERRENLTAVLETQAERRAISADRRLILTRAGSRGALRSHFPRTSGPAILEVTRSRSMVTPGQLTKSLPAMPDTRSLMVLDKALLRTGKALTTKFPADKSPEQEKHSVENEGPESDVDARSSLESNEFQAGKDDTESEAAQGVENSYTAMVPFNPAALDTGQPYQNQHDVHDSAMKLGNDGGHADEPCSGMLVCGEVISKELETKWILNLSMTYRDGSPREKFFVTFLQDSLWRRVTISLDYRDCEAESIEGDLFKMTSQRQKSRRIYREIRSSLDEINFFETVTNLRLETCDSKLHIHVSEDVNEVISHPTTYQLKYLHCNFVRYRDVIFESHASGFVYRVSVGGRLMILKEIPGRESVDEFLYEVNALHALRPSLGVINVFGLVLDDENPDYHHADYKPVTGILIEYAENGALVDILHDSRVKGVDIPLITRLKWAQQITQGLADIHEAGFVQGDFTLANIVIDGFDNAKIIDINRRGCPVGWEPPEAIPIIRTKQRLNMYIGIKSDLFQLGMVLWSLATQYDAPEACERPLSLDEHNTDMPFWFRDVVAICLSSSPLQRPQASELLTFFPSANKLATPAVYQSSRPTQKLYDYTDSEDSEYNYEARGRSPMYFGRRSELNPLVWTSPPSYSPSEIDSEEDPDMSRSVISNKSAESVNLYFKYQDAHPHADSSTVSTQSAGLNHHKSHHGSAKYEFDENLYDVVTPVVPADTDTDVELGADAYLDDTTLDQKSKLAAHSSGESGLAHYSNKSQTDLNADPSASIFRPRSSIHSVSSSVHSSAEFVGAPSTAHTSSNGSAATSIALDRQRRQSQNEGRSKGRNASKNQGPSQTEVGGLVNRGDMPPKVLVTDEELMHCDGSVGLLAAPAVVAATTVQ
ncbi:Proto-oncogene tyrosine-protein kinase LCK [Ceratocystis lukuohia]|uniref:Proto-oncogene tyrosine-protein kinase LCK n=1 Tax=Ceratocystis lukuohia TaxID=2019550 RepID=A0ABR4MMV7_9PEZI